MKCFLCNNTSLKTIYSLPNKTIVSCLNDDLFFARGKTDTLQTDDLYDHHYYDQYPYSNALGLNRRYFTNKIKLLKKLKHPNLKVLDIGCGWGDLLAVFKEQGVDYLGIDTSLEAINRCQKKGLNCIKTSVETLAQKSLGTYDGIFSFHTIEHIENPFSYLAAIKKLLKPGGILLLTTPNNNSPFRKLQGSKWSVYHHDSHFVFYNKENIKTPLEKAGFVNIKVRIDPIRFFSLSYIISRLKKETLTDFNQPRLTRLILTLPLPTDPFGDLEVVGFKNE